MANVHVNLLFEANTQNAKNNINQLAQLLNQVSNTKIGVESGSISQAAQAARDLQLHLGNAVNVNTGKLDLTKLNTSLKQSNQSLTTLSTQLVNAGTTGQQAFVKLANSIASAQVPAFKLGATITTMMKTMTSAAMWSVAYGALDSLTQAFTGAIDYAKDLNEALTDIAIVSDLSAEQLDDFAVKASKAAKELKTTTTEYAKAALIFYQQGLNGKAVEERTETVVKMAQVTGQSMETISNQLTAVWNNFYDGSKSLEYYADVLNKLGAETASSTDEITQGLEKFAAVADTVGLSYEYAASALATVTAETRQSADVVGTAFKTLFARLEGLQLGETLDDGTTLNKYSQALETVGVSIKNSNGELRDMDYILDDLGSKWQLLSKDQQIALAQTVGGMRQYNQFISLMDNYDTFKVNVDISIGAEGELELQQEKWAQSAEAAAKEVEQAWNDLYSQILDDDTVIEFTKAIADVIGFFGQLIDNAGGLGPILLMVAGIFSNKLIPLVTKFGTDLIGGFKIAFGLAQKETEKTQLQFQQMLKSMVQEGNLSATMQQQLALSDQMLSKKLEIEKAMIGANEAQKKQLQNEMAILEYYNQEAQQLAHKTKELQEQAQLSKQKVTYSMDGGAMRKAANDYAQEEHKQLWDLGQQKGTKINSLNAVIKHGDSEKEKKLREEILKIDEKIEATRQRKERAQNSATGSKTELIVGKTNAQSMLFDKDNAAVQSMLTNKNLGLQDIVEVDEKGKMSAEASINNLEKMTKARLEYNNIAERSRTLEQELSNLTISSQDGNLVAAYIAEAQALEALNQAKAEAAQYPDDPSKKEALIVAENKHAAAIKKVASLEINASATSRQSAKTIAQVAKSYEDLAKKANLPEKSISKVTTAINNLKTGSGSTKQNIETLKKGFIEMALSADLTSDNLQLLAKDTVQTLSQFGSDEELEQFIAKLKEGDETSRRYAQALEQAKNAADRLGKQSVNAGQIAGKGFTAMAQTMGSLSMAWQSLQSIIDTFNDEDATGLEKTMSLLMGLTMILPTVSSLFSKNSAVMEFANMISLKLAASSGAVAAGKTAETGATAANTPVAAANAAAWYAHPIFWIVAVIAAAIAAIALLSVALDNNTEKVKTNAEKAQESYEANTESLERMKNAVAESNAEIESLAETLKGLRDTTDAFDNLVVGSTAWNENLQKSTEYINELLEKYPELINSGWFEYDKITGTYQATNMEAIEQYVMGQAKLENMTLQIGQSRAQYRKDLSANELSYQKDREEIVNKFRDDPIEIPVITKYSNPETQEIDTVVIGNQEAQIRGSIEGVAEDANATLSEFSYRLIEEGKTLEEIKKDLETEGNYFYVEQAYEAYKEVLDASEELTHIEEERLKKEKEITEQYRDQARLTAQSTLSNFIEYSDFSNVKKQAATEIAAQNLLQEKNNLSITSGMDLTQQDFDQLGSFIGVDIGTTRDAANDEVNAKGESTDRVDFGDLISKSSNEFRDAFFGDYLKAQYGHAGDFESFMENNLGKYTSEGIEIQVNGEPKLISYQDVYDYEVGSAQVEAQEKLIEDLKNASEQAAALSTGNLQSLSPEETQEIVNMAKGGLDSTEKKNELMREGLELAKQMGKTEEEYWASVQEQAQNYDADLYNSLQQQADLQAGNSYISSVAEQYDLDAEVVKNYARSLQEVNKEFDISYEMASKLAVSNARLSEGLSSLRDKWEESSITLNQYTKDSYEWMEVATDLAKDLSEIFGVTISTEFIDQYQEQIDQLVKGGEEAQEVYEELEAAAARDYVASFNLEGDYEDQFNNLITYLTNLEDGYTIGMDADISAFTESLNTMLTEGLMTKEEMEAIFNSFGWAPEFKESERKKGSPSTQWIVESTYSDGFDGSATKTTYKKIETQNEFVTWSIGNAVPYMPKSSPSISSPPKTSSSGSGSSSKSRDGERYHEISEELDDLERQYNRISSAKDRAWGPQKLQYLEKEKEATDRLIEANDKYLQQIESNLGKDWGTLSQYGAKRDEETGRITNYDELYAKYKNSSDEEFEAFEDALSQYEETLNLWEEQLQEREELRLQRIDEDLETVQIKVEYTTELISDAITLLEYQLEELNDPIQDAAESFAKLGKIAEQSLNKANAYAKGLKDTLSLSGFSKSEINTLLNPNSSDKEISSILKNKDFTADQISDMQAYANDLLSDNDYLTGLQDQAIEKVTNALEEMNAEMEEQGEIIEHNNSIIESYRNIIDLVGKDTLGISDEIMAKLTRTSVEGARSSLQVAKSTLEMNKKALADMEAEYAAISNTLSEEDKKRWEEAIDAAKEKVRESESEVQSLWEGALQAAADAFEQAVETAIETFKDAMAGAAGSAEALERTYEQQKTLADLYLKDYQKIYELSKLTRDINNSMDSTNSIKGKERLAEIQEEINALQESGAKMTQYEVDELRAKYDLRLAEIALEEAQNAKSQVRMQRDVSGNWSYVYTADQDSVDQARQNYEDKLYAYQTLTDKYISEMQDRLIAIPGEMAEAMLAIRREDYASEAEYQAALDEVRRFYSDMYTHYIEQTQIAIGNSKEFYEEDWTKYSEATGYKISDNRDWIDSFDETIYSQVTGFTEAQAAHAAFNVASEKLLSQLTEAFSQWYADVDGIMSDAGTSIEGFGKKAETTADKVKKQNDKTAKSATDMATKHKKAFNNIVDAAGTFFKEYSKKIEATKDKNAELYNSLQKILNLISTINNTPVNPKLPDSDGTGPRGPGGDDVPDTNPDKTANTYSLTGYATAKSKRNKGGDTFYKLSDKQEVENIVSGKAFDTEYYTEKGTRYYKTSLTLADGTTKKVWLTADQLKANKHFVEYDFDLDNGGSSDDNNSPIVSPKDTDPPYEAGDQIEVNGVTLGASYPHADMPNLYTRTVIDDGQIFTIAPNAPRVTNTVQVSTLKQKVPAGETWIKTTADLGNGDLWLPIKDVIPLSSFDTGGYTGSWDSSGRLAMLHQKEIVLNAHDTENFLAGIDILRSITKAIDLQAVAQSNALGSMMRATVAQTNAQTIQQEVTIHAEFPNATNHSEIEEAFETLLTRATQFANRKI